MANVALVEKVPSKTDFIRHFDNDFQFDRFSLCSDRSKKKILKRDFKIKLLKFNKATNYYQMF